MKPILFRTPMVQSILEGRKTQTRRINNLKEVNECPEKWKFEVMDKIITCDLKKISGAIFNINGTNMRSIFGCPFGQIGDILWVREEHKIWFERESENICATVHCEFMDGTIISYYAKKLPLKTLENLAKRKTLGKWQRARFLPKQFARIFLQITNIRIERLQKITSHDAQWEGIIENGEPFIPRYIDLWNDINGKDSWNQNPWVWVIEFKQIEKPL